MGLDEGLCVGVDVGDAVELWVADWEGVIEKLVEEDEEGLGLENRDGLCDGEDVCDGDVVELGVTDELGLGGID